jgi:hypothetical protein
MGIRLILLALLAGVAFFVFRAAARRIQADPRLRRLLTQALRSGVLLRVAQLVLLRRAGPWLLRALGALRFFR